MRTYPKKLTLTIEVTADDIKRGKKTNLYQCPIAIATRRAAHAAGFQLKACVTEMTVELRRRNFNTVLIADNPRRIVGWITDFDEGLTVNPTRFKLVFKAVK